jgi:hypothetical protein
MKTSSGLLLGVLFTLVVVIVAVVIYFNTRPEEKTKTSTGPSSTLPSIGDFTIAQTLSQNSDSETYTIEPYTIEYAEGDNEKSLSKNVTFTLNWTNGGGFETVSKIRVEHYIREKGTNAALQTVEVNDNRSGTAWDSASVSVKISGLPDDNVNQYSFVGDNMFKVLATYDGNKEYTLYDGTGALGVGETHPPELVIKPGDLTATINMTGSIEKVFNVSLLTGTRGTTKDIVNKSYTFTATSLINDVNAQPYNVSILKGIELIAQDTTGTEFKFKYGELHPTLADRGNYVAAELNTETKKMTLFTVAQESKASKITFAKSYLDESDRKDSSGIADPGDTYRMLRISNPKCITSDDGCNGDEGKPNETEAGDTQFLYLYGDHRTNNTGKSWLGLTGRTKEEMPMKHWKIEETTTE